MSPPLVVALALAGRVDIDLTRDPLGVDAAGVDGYLRDGNEKSPGGAADRQSRKSKRH